MVCNYMHAQCVHISAHACACVHICAHACMLMLHKLYACTLVACFYKMFPHTENIHYFRTTKQDLSRQQKMSNMTTGKKDLKQLSDIDHFFTFNSNVSNIVDYCLFNKQTVKSGLKRKRDPENIVGTKKSKKSLRRL